MALRVNKQYNLWEYLKKCAEENVWTKRRKTNKGRVNEVRNLFLFSSTTWVTKMKVDDKNREWIRLRTDEKHRNNLSKKLVIVRGVDFQWEWSVPRVLLFSIQGKKVWGRFTCLGISNRIWNFGHDKESSEFRKCEVLLNHVNHIMQHLIKKVTLKFKIPAELSTGQYFRESSAN